MKILSIGSDRSVFKEGSSLEERLKVQLTSEDRLHVIIFSLKKHGYSPLNLGGSIFIYPTNSRFKFLYIVDAWRIVKGLSGERFDVVTTQDPFESGLAGYLCAKTLGAKIQFQIHTDFLSPYFRAGTLLNRLRVFLAKRMLPRADCVRVVSGRIAESIERAGISLKQPSYILPVYLDRAILNRQPGDFLHVKYPKFKRFILTVSRLEKEKNLPLAIGAFARVSVRFPDTALVIVGSGNDRERIETKVKDFKLASKVFFEGWQQDASSYYESASVFLSTSWYEGYGASLIEAAVLLPVVTTDVGMARELLGDTGARIVPPGDKEALAEALVEALEKQDSKEWVSAARGAVNLHLKERDEYRHLYQEGLKRCFL